MTRAPGTKLALVTICLVGMTIFPESLSAHSDPLGDIYPNVKVERGNFAIEFENNEAEAQGDSHSPLRMIFSPVGVLLSPRHVERRRLDLDETLGYPAKTRFRLDDETLDFRTVDLPQPGYVAEKKNKKEIHRLPWPADFKCEFEAAWADQDSICIASIRNQNLFLSHFRRHRFQFPDTVRITAPQTLSFIWNFPVVSNLVKVSGRYCIAWPRYEEKDQAFRCIISTWKPGETLPREIIVREPADWNSHLSLAAIGDRLCLAYHCLAGDYAARSKIITVFRAISPN